MWKSTRKITFKCILSQTFLWSQAKRLPTEFLLCNDKNMQQKTKFRNTFETPHCLFSVQTTNNFRAKTPSMTDFTPDVWMGGVLAFFKKGATNKIQIFYKDTPRHPPPLCKVCFWRRKITYKFIKIYKYHPPPLCKVDIFEDCRVGVKIRKNS